MLLARFVDKGVPAKPKSSNCPMAVVLERVDDRLVGMAVIVVVVVVLMVLYYLYRLIRQRFAGRTR
jgi:hypothetical protein